MPAALARLNESGRDLHAVAGWLVAALPALFLIGRAPADVALTLVAALFLAESARRGIWSWLRTPWVALALALWLYLGLASLFADQVGDALERALPFGRFVLFAAACQHWLLVDPAVRRRLLLVLALVIAFVLLDTLLQYASGRDVFGFPYEERRLTGPFRDRVPGSFLAKTALPVLGLAFGWAAARPQRLAAMLAVAALAALVLVTIALTGERMAFLTFLLGLGILFLLLPPLRLPLLATGLAGVLLVGGALVLHDGLRNRLVGHTAYDLEDFWNKRYGELFRRAVGVWRSEPLIGVGLKNFRDACVNQHFEALGPVEERCYTHPHNQYLEWLAEAGVIGLAGFLALIALWLRSLVPGARHAGVDAALAAGTLAALAVFLWPLMTSRSFFSNWNAILFWLMLGLALAVCAPRPLLSKPGATSGRSRSAQQPTGAAQDGGAGRRARNGDALSPPS